MITERDKKQLDAIIAIVKPAHSLEARLEKLSDERRAYYARWKARFEQWSERCKADDSLDDEPDARPYASMLAGHGPPMMRRSVETALFGETPRVLLNASDEHAAQMWLNEVQK
ncbi:hypothetical protein [Bradyrhizobium japonicum]|uniref:hypothetical protein n=1 Tax=Bradyrhizobium japonicum TaxID=375 RepID=UPI000576773F|nr:hypothetical protein [Bradyrhizobium japonicum]